MPETPCLFDITQKCSLDCKNHLKYRIMWKSRFTMYNLTNSKTNTEDFIKMMRQRKMEDPEGFFDLSNFVIESTDQETKNQCLVLKNIEN